LSGKLTETALLLDAKEDKIKFIIKSFDGQYSKKKKSKQIYRISENENAHNVTPRSSACHPSGLIAFSFFDILFFKAFFFSFFFSEILF